MANAFLSLFQSKKPVFAMLHLKGDTPEEKVAIAKKETALYYDNGVDAVIVEDYFGRKNEVETVLQWLQKEHPDKVYGINVLDNFHKSFEWAVLYGAKFIQIDSVAGHLPPGPLDAAYAAMVAAYRAAAPVFVLGGVRFKYQPVLSGRSLEEDLKLGMQRCDAMVVTGEGTGMDTDDAKISEFRRVLGPDFPLVVGAGTTPQNAAEKLSLADAAIVGSTFKDTGKDTGDVSAEKVKAFITAVRAL